MIQKFYLSRVARSTSTKELKGTTRNKISILRHPFSLSFEEHGLKRFLFFLLDAVDYAIFASHILYILYYGIVQYVRVIFSYKDLKDKLPISLDF